MRLLPAYLEVSFPFLHVSMLLVESNYVRVAWSLVEFFEEGLDRVLVSLSLAFDLYGIRAR